MANQCKVVHTTKALRLMRHTADRLASLRTVLAIAETALRAVVTEIEKAEPAKLGGGA